MSTEQNTKANGNPESRKPAMYGYSVRPIGDGKRSSWSKIAAAWAHKDGDGFEVRFDALPVDGRMVFRAPKDDDQPDTSDGEVIDRRPDGLS